MKTLHALLAIVVSVALAALTVGAGEPTPEVALRFVPADEALQSIKNELGAEAAGIVSSVDLRRNTLVLAAGQAQEAKVRAFLTKLDQRKPQVKIAATVTRKTPATPTAPAAEEIVARPVIITAVDKSASIEIQGDKGVSYRVEMKVTPLP
jgi:hypothetical protein